MELGKPGAPAGGDTTGHNWPGAAGAGAPSSSRSMADLLHLASFGQ